MAMVSAHPMLLNRVVAHLNAVVAVVAVAVAVVEVEVVVPLPQLLS